ncbi:hypothetical protein GCM10028775_43000 [Catellatospora paridis]
MGQFLIGAGDAVHVGTVGRPPGRAHRDQDDMQGVRRRRTPVALDAARLRETRQVAQCQLAETAAVDEEAMPPVMAAMMAMFIA